MCTVNQLCPPLLIILHSPVGTLVRGKEVGVVRQVDNTYEGEGEGDHHSCCFRLNKIYLSRLASTLSKYNKVCVKNYGALSLTHVHNRVIKQLVFLAQFPDLIYLTP